LDDKEINITYETLFELLRRERNRDEIQELNESFFRDIIEYIQSKKNILGKGDMFSAEQEKKTKTQLENVNKILRELYEKRERKLISMALTKSRTGSDIIDTGKLLPEEKLFYEDVRQICDRYREDILTNILSCKLPTVRDSSVEASQPNPEADIKMVRFLAPVPKFVGKELETYGPFDVEDVVSLPSDIARVLVEKGRAAEIEE